ncbi:MAG: SdpI family protein [Clostridia bacterium]|nr:SdpI family protein [Clostridia bacterium]
MKFNKVLLIVTSILILLPILVGALTWDILPEQMATHWGTDGTVNDWSSRAFAVFGLPMILLVVHWICIIITAADHRKSEQNKKAYNMVLFIIPLVSWFCNGLMYTTAFGVELDMMSLIFGLFGVMFIVIGNYMPKISQNHTLGIKMSWTLESEENWNATHRVAGKVWFVAGLISLICVFIPYKISAFIMPVLLVAAIAIPIVYSYKFHLKEKKEGKTFMKNKKLKKYYVISGIIVGVIFAVLMFIMFTGEIEISYTDDGFIVDSMYTNPYTVKYTDIGGTQYSEEYIDGHKVYGFNSAKLMMGIFENDKYGKYQRFTYTGNNGFIIIETMDEKYIILGGKNLGATRELFDELTEKIAG